MDHFNWWYLFYSPSAEVGVEGFNFGLSFGFGYCHEEKSVCFLVDEGRSHVQTESDIQIKRLLWPAFVYKKLPRKRKKLKIIMVLAKEILLVTFVPINSTNSKNHVNSQLIKLLNKQGPTLHNVLNKKSRQNNVVCACVSIDRAWRSSPVRDRCSSPSCYLFSALAWQWLGWFTASNTSFPESRVLSLALNIGAVTSGMPRFLLPDKFEDGDFATFKKSFQPVATANAWDDAGQLAALPLALTGRAFH